MLIRLFQLLKRILKRKDRVRDISILIQSNTAQDIVNNIEQVKVNKEVVQEQVYFARKNSLAEMFWDEPPSIINGDGTMYYKKGDIRNTFDPTKKRIFEDYDGTLHEEGSISGTYELGSDVSKHEDDFDKEHKNNFEEEREKLLKLYQDSMKEKGQINYQEYLNQQKSTDNG